MTNKLQEYFPMIRSRREILTEMEKQRAWLEEKYQQALARIKELEEG